jgi:hypothetical protein
LAYALLILPVSFSCALAADLNAPIEQTPTLASEIRRGDKAASAHFLEGYNKIEPYKFASCVIDHDKANGLERPDGRAFSLGLNFGAWRWATIEMDIAHKSPKDKLSRSIATVAGKFSPQNFVIWREYQKMLDVSDADILNFMDVPDAVRNETLLEFKTWDKRTADASQSPQP